jgi:hypothetical protein
MSASRQSFFTSSRLTLVVAVLVLFGLGLGLRLNDLTNLPLDFHPTRQLLSALKARGMYYQYDHNLPEWQRRMAVQQWKTRAEVEPETFERLVAFTYRFTGVELWVARVYSSLFWLIGGILLLLLIKDLVSVDAAVISTAYFMFLPFAVVASRSFQPDPLMVMLIVAFWWAVTRWAKTQSWGWALLGGLVGGFAIYTKFVAAFFVVGAAVGSILGHPKGTSLLRKPQVWMMSALGILPAGIYIFYGVVLHGFLGRQFNGRFIPALLLSPINYVQWASLANIAAGGLGIMFGLLGLFFAREERLRTFLAGVWGGYLAFGLFFNYHIATHDYYQLPLIPLVAVSAAPVADVFLAHLNALAWRPWTRIAAYCVLLYGLLGAAWLARSQMKAVDYRPQAAMWIQIGDRLGHGPNVVALTQDYGSRLAYWGWQNALIWPNSGDTDYHEARGASISFPEMFSKMTVGNAFFLVTDFEELNRQPDLKQRLASFAVHTQGDGYIVYDLQKPLAP